MADLKTTYKDDLLDTSVNEKRKYNMIQNADGTVSFEDVTTYSQIGDSFGAADINATNKKVNEVNSNLIADGTPFRFGKDAEGNFGYILTDEIGADSVIPFSSKFGLIPTILATANVGAVSTWVTVSLSDNINNYKAIAIVGDHRGGETSSIGNGYILFPGSYPQFSVTPSSMAIMIIDYLKSLTESTPIAGCGMNGSATTAHLYIKYIDETTIQLMNSYNENNIFFTSTKVIGLN